MRIVIDANVLFAAMIRNSVTRKLILDYDGLFLFPEAVLEEAEEHMGELMEKSGMTKGEFGALLSMLLNKGRIIPAVALLPYKAAAIDAVKGIDPDDAPFIACCLAHPGSALWSDDKALKRQGAVRVLDTAEIAALL